MGSETLETEVVEKKEHQLILEIISHINQIEKKIIEIHEKTEELEDIETVNKLDIINLRNEIDKISMALPNISPEVMVKFESIEKLADEVKDADEWRKVIKSIRKVEEDLKKERSPEFEKLKQQLYFISQRVGELERDYEPKKTADVIEIKDNVKDLEEKLRDLRSTINSNKGRISKIGPSISALEDMELKKDSKYNPRFCSNCGARLSQDQQFCSVCNKKLK